MDISNAVSQLSALAQGRRLGAFRLLVRAGPGGMAAGDIATALGIPHNTLSTHIGLLEQAGLVRSTRDGRRVLYSVDFEGTRALLTFLLEDCCQAAPEIAGPAVEATLIGCCADPKTPSGASS